MLVKVKREIIRMNHPPSARIGPGAGAGAGHAALAGAGPCDDEAGPW
jgi:hypothetical protein